MEIFIIRSTNIKPTFFEILGILKCNKKEPIKKYTFQKIVGHAVYLTLKNMKFRKKYMCAPNFENRSISKRMLLKIIYKKSKKDSKKS